MQIKSTFKNKSGQNIEITYNDMDSEQDLGDRKIQGVHSYCFYNDKMLVVYSDKKGYWTPPGGGVEKGEDVSTAIAREVKEESNMKVVAQRIIGCQDITEPQGTISQVRSVCIIEPYGLFEIDPDGDITKIELIDPKDYKQYFDWGEIGDHLMKRALEIKKEIMTK